MKTNILFLVLFLSVYTINAQEKIQKYIASEKYEKALKYCISKTDNSECECNKIIAEKINTHKKTKEFNEYYSKAVDCYKAEKNHDKVVSMYKQLNMRDSLFVFLKSICEHNEGKYNWIKSKKYSTELAGIYTKRAKKKLYNPKPKLFIYNDISKIQEYKDLLKATHYYKGEKMCDSLKSIGDFMLKNWYSMEGRVYEIYSNTCKPLVKEMAMMHFAQISDYGYKKHEDITIKYLKESYGENTKNLNKTLDSLAATFKNDYKGTQYKKKFYTASGNIPKLYEIYKADAKTFSSDKKYKSKYKKYANLLGNKYYSEKKYSQALKYYEEAGDSANTKKTASIHMYLFKTTQNDNNKAYYYYHKISYLKIINDTLKLKATYNNVAKYLLDNKRYYEAKNFYRKAGNSVEYDKATKKYTKAFYDNGDGTVNWYDRIVIQKSHKKQVTWQQAYDYCKNLSIAGKEWHVLDPASGSMLIMFIKEKPNEFNQLFSKSERNLYWSNEKSQYAYGYYIYPVGIKNWENFVRSPEANTVEDERTKKDYPICVKCASYQGSLIRNNTALNNVYLSEIDGKVIN